MLIKGLNIVVTGASSGLGRHFALTLARHGANLAVCARRMALLNELVGEITAAGGRAVAAQLDVTSADSVNRVFDAVSGEFGAPDVLVNNSGISVGKPLLEQTEEDWDRVVDTNLKGAFLVSNAFARGWRAIERGGSIINIASILGIRQAGGAGPYAVSKAALIQLTKVAALEWARHSIRVNAIAPGYIETDINRGFWQTPAGQAMAKRIPQRGLGKPEDLDGALLLLCSALSARMTGIVIPVDGGHLVGTL